MNAALLILLMRMGPVVVVAAVPNDELSFAFDALECRLGRNALEVVFDTNGDLECKIAGSRS